MAKQVPERATFMRPMHISAMGKYPRTHSNCLKLTGVARPGKTAKDRALRGVK